MLQFIKNTFSKGQVKESKKQAWEGEESLWECVFRWSPVDSMRTCNVICAAEFAHTWDRRVDHFYIYSSQLLPMKLSYHCGRVQHKSQDHRAKQLQSSKGSIQKVYIQETLVSASTPGSTKGWGHQSTPIYIVIWGMVLYGTVSNYWKLNILNLLSYSLLTILTYQKSRSYPTCQKFKWVLPS